MHGSKEPQRFPLGSRPKALGNYPPVPLVENCSVGIIIVERYPPEVGGGGAALNISYKNEQGRLDRGKVIPQDVFPRNEKNDAMAAEWRKHADHIKVLREEMEKIKGKMKCYVPPDPEPEEPEKK